MKNLPVTIVQSTSDEGTGILNHVKNGLGAHHSPDVFHVQNEIVKALLEEAKALQAFYAAESHQARMKQAIRKIGALYHPLDLETGKLKSPDEISNSLDQCFAEIEIVATEAKLSAQSLKRINA